MNPNLERDPTSGEHTSDNYGPSNELLETLGDLFEMLQEARGKILESNIDLGLKKFLLCMVGIIDSLYVYNECWPEELKYRFNNLSNDLKQCIWDIFKVFPVKIIASWKVIINQWLGDNEITDETKTFLEELQQRLSLPDDNELDNYKLHNLHRRFQNVNCKQ